MIKLQNVSKVFGTGIFGLENINLDISKGEFVFLVGQTGSGKTTLLKLLIRETLPTEGTIAIADWDITKLPKSKIPHLRKKIGIIFQDLKLLMDRTIFENVLLPLEITGVSLKDASIRVEELLSQVGILEHRDKFPVQLSGGELQRAAIARALTLHPDIILADEPTGNLDDKTAFEIVSLLEAINQAGTTIIMATHNTNILNKYTKNRLVRLQKGKLIEDKNKKEPTVTVAVTAVVDSTKLVEPQKREEPSVEKGDALKKEQPQEEIHKHSEKVAHAKAHNTKEKHEKEESEKIKQKEAAK